MIDRYRKAILLLGDIAVMYLALALALLLRDGGPNFLVSTWGAHFWGFTVLHAVWAVILYIDGFYALTRLRLNTSFLQGLIRIVLFNALAGIIFFYVFNTFGITPKTVLALHVGLFVLLFVGWRGLAGRLLRFDGWRQPIVILEAGSEGAVLANDLTDDPFGAYRVAAVCNLEGGGETVCRLAWEHGAQAVVVGEKAWRNLPPELYDLALSGIRVVDASAFREENERRLPLESDDLAWFLAGFRDSHRPEFETGKRVVDAASAVALAAVMSPVLVLVACAVKMAGGPGPVLFVQERTGRHGRPFRLYKFRTMREDAEATGPQWSAGRSDPRVTALGHFLRHTHLDEAPQLWNILRGEMSFIGPRPERPVFVEELKGSLPYYGLRHLVRPGITGWAQINYRYGASVEDAAQKLTYDLWYVKNRGAAVDVKIALKTAAMVFRGEGR